MQDKIFPVRAKAPPPPVPALLRRYPDSFGSAMAARRFVQLIHFPPSRAWRYQLNGKSGSTYMLNLLFELEYGTPFTCHVDHAETGNQHPEFALFQLPQAGLWANAIQAGDKLGQFLNFPGLSLATVRNPFDRALSGFRYLCRSHRLGDRRFLAERLRLNALARFDWSRDGDTPAGFARFLGYLRDSAAAQGADSLDPHWMPQSLHLRPEIYRPDMVGRTEDLDSFARALARRLDRPLPDLARLRRNSGDRDTRAIPADFLTPTCRALIEEVYEEDFELFEYPRGGVRPG